MYIAEDEQSLHIIIKCNDHITQNVKPYNIISWLYFYLVDVCFKLRLKICI